MNHFANDYNHLHYILKKALSIAGNLLTCLNVNSIKLEQSFSFIPEKETELTAITFCSL